jgi:TPR repeat protein
MKGCGVVHRDVGRFVIVITVVLGVSQARADFAAGVHAYERGDCAAALAQWRAAAEEGDVRSADALGSLCHFGRGVERNEEQAAHWFRKAAEQGFAVAQTHLGYAYGGWRGRLPKATRSRRRPRQALLRRRRCSA